MKLTEAKLRQIIRSVLQEAVITDEYSVVPITEEVMAYWAEELGVNPRRAIHPDYSRMYLDENNILRVETGNYGMGYIGLVVQETGKIYVDGPYGSQTLPLKNLEDLYDESNSVAFEDLFKNWARYAQGDTRGALELNGTWD